MARFCTLFSGSDGNCAYVSASGTSVLIDAGRSCKQILLAMEARDIMPGSIKGILLTHEHTDHISALRVLLKKLRVPLYASSEVLEYLRGRALIEENTIMRAVESGTRFSVEGIEAECFDTPHDSVHSVGYRFFLPDGRRAAVATDMGYISDTVREKLSGCDLILLESNYDKDMLSACDYPYTLKRRIASRDGHLSNDDCSKMLCELVRSGSTRFILGHLSKNTNFPELAHRSALCAFSEQGMRENIDFKLSIAPRSEPSEMVIV